MANRIGKNGQAARVKQLILGTQKHFPNGSDKLQVGGATFTVTALTQLFQSFVDQREAVEAARAFARAKVETERSKAPSQHAVIRAFETVVRGSFGNSADALADFGLAPPKARTPMSAEQKAVASAKRAATRKARGPIGKNKRKLIKGAVQAELVVTPLDAHSVGTPSTPSGRTPTGAAPRATS
ncbi:MAG TPA: hypothetical protein VGY54_25550 [Polyangiaceae bacterium]|jgi:hypothetical protein|nr:hypothetical protein [Polyangiaceae bacterium]